MIKAESILVRCRQRAQRRDTTSAINRAMDVPKHIVHESGPKLAILFFQSEPRTMQVSRGLHGLAARAAPVRPGADVHPANVSFLSTIHGGQIC